MTNKIVTKQFAADLVEVEATTDESGRFTALVSAFGVLDSQGDIIDKGAFAKSVERVSGGAVMPVVWSHDYSNPHAIIGEVTELRETDVGLEVDAVLDVEDSELAREVHRHMLKGRIREFSVGGEVTGWEFVSPDANKAADGEEAFPEFHITDLDLWEVGPCFKGANPATELMSVKTMLAAKEGRVLAQRHVDALRDLYEQLGTVLAAVEPAPKEEPTDGEAHAVESKSSGDRPAAKNLAALRLTTIERM